MPEVRLDGHSDNVLLDDVLMVKVGGNSILQLLQGTNDRVEACEFPSLWHSELATLRVSWLLPSFTRIGLSVIHFDTWLPSKRVIFTPAVCPLLFEFLTTLTFEALRKNPFKDIIKKKDKNKNNETSSSTCGQQCITKCQEHNRSKKGTLREKKFKINRP